MTAGEGSQSVEVRHAGQGDADLLVDWIAKVAKESENRTLDPRSVASGVAAALADPSHRRYYIAEQGDQRVGCCLVTTEWSDWSATWYWWLQSIYVEPGHRGDDPGVLDALVAHIHKEARRQGVRTLSLYVDGDNARAIRAYEKRGYKKTDYLVYQKAA